MKYTFDPLIAKKYGVEGAVIIENLYFWIMKNKANDKNCFDGEYWTYNSVKAFEELFPFWSKRQIERILKNLEKGGAIKTGNYNKSSYDRTKWYALTDIVYSIYANGEMKITESLNGITETVEPIPDINTYINTNDKPDNKHLYVEAIKDKWNSLNLSSIVSIKNQRLKHTKARIKEVGEDEFIKAIESINQSSFLQGKNNRNWIISYDWFVNPDNFTKVIEGKYIDKQQVSNGMTKEEYEKLRQEITDQFNEDNLIECEEVPF